MAHWVDVPHADNDNNDTEVDGRMSGYEVHAETDDRMLDAEENEIWRTTPALITESQAGIVQTKLNVTYTATAEVISVKMQ